MTITVSGVFVYPVKSLGGISLPQSSLDARGLKYDRQWMVVDEDGNMVTQRQEPKLALIRATIEPEQDALWLNSPKETLRLPLSGNPRAELVRVRVWNEHCEAFDQGSDDSFLLMTVIGKSFYRIVRLSDHFHRRGSVFPAGPDFEVGFADAYPLLIASEGSLGALNNRLERKGSPLISMDRFRPNIVVRGCNPHDEDEWSRILAGGVELKAVKTCERCVITTVDQRTGSSAGGAGEPLRTLAEYRRNERGKVIFGMNYVHLDQGTISVGDEVQVLS
jgi:uncharacterized protein